MEIVTGHREDERVRNAFFNLSREIFELDFEPWYRDGFWGDSYQPYSVMIGERMAANVSASVMLFDEGGSRKCYVQLGTVMTAKEYRGRGLSKLLIGFVLDQYRDMADGFYLFANDRVLDFYPRFGFRRAQEYCYELELCTTGQMEAVRVPMETAGDFARFGEVLNVQGVNAALDMRDNPGLFMFYLSQFMKECVYYVESQDAYVVADWEGDRLNLHQVFCSKKVDLVRLADAFGGSFRGVKFGFVPLDSLGFLKTKDTEKDTALFVLGEDFEHFEDKGLKFPTLSHT